MRKIATQIFGLVKEISADLHGTIQAVHDAGFDAIEPVVIFGKKQGEIPKNLWALDTLENAAGKMSELGMTMPSAHIGVSFLGFALPVLLIKRNILMLHEKYQINDFVLNGAFSTVKKAKWWARLARKVSNAVRPHGCRILYHNHDDEFTKVSYHGKQMKAIDVFLELTGDDVMLQLDIGWAGITDNAATIVEQYANRIGLLHLKDFYAEYMDGGYTRRNMPVEAFAPIGEGAIATKKVLSMLDKLPNLRGPIIIDQDKCNTEMLKELENGCSNIHAMLTGADQE